MLDMIRVRSILALTVLLVSGGSATAVMLPGGGPQRSDCFVVLMSNGLGFPAGTSRARGATCADGDVCDADGTRDGVCHFTPMVCLNAVDPALARCSTAQISAVTFKGKIGKSRADTSGFDAALAGLGLPSAATACSAPVDWVVPVGGPDKKGELVRGTGRVQAKARTTKGGDKDKFEFVCLPSVGGAPTTTVTTSTSTTSSSTTTVEGQTTTTTSIPPPAGIPGAGLEAHITAAGISPSGQVTVTFTLTDAAGTAVVPRTGATSNPNEARVRMTIARLEVLPETVEGFTTTFTRYVNYITGSAASGSQPTYDTTGTFALVDAATGTWTYTFGRMLPADLPRNLTHTVGAQIERTVGGVRSIVNPLLNFVPDGSPVTTVREVTTTAQCNTCHDPLALHGGGRREVGLCQLCHTDQAVDPDTGNEIDLKHMVHRIHMGKDLPSVTEGAVGAKYAIVGFQGAEAVYGEKVKTCASGPRESVPCETDADCDGGTCTATATVGVGFPQDIRNCTKCHASGATAADHEALPSALACTGCHDDVNPSETTLNGLPPGTGHLAGPQPDAFCRLCHKETQDDEFDITVPGAHVIPLRSATLAGLTAEIVSVSGAAGGPVTVEFRLRDGAGNPLTSFTGLNRIGFAISGSTRDYGGASTPLITATAFGGGATGTLSGPDGTGLATYTTATNLPADATGTWAVGLEARRAVTVNGQSVNEAAPNPVAYLSVDGSAVVERREVVADANCQHCHGTFSKDFSIHGNLRNRVEYCVVCHNANVTDFARRRNAVATGADPANEPIAFKHLIHKIHRGEELERQPYLVYGFGAAPKNYTAVNLGEVLFPGDLRDCSTCHTGGSELLPLPSGVLPTVQSMVSGGVEVVTGHTPPVTDACTACHDSDAAAAHAETNTTAAGAEACAVCHGEGSVAAVSEVHAQDP
jgi:OmcA/MtrC family decaheme c-type cytochrome